MIKKQLLLVTVCICLFSGEFAAQNSSNSPDKPATTKRYIFASPQTKKTPAKTSKKVDGANNATNNQKIVIITPNRSGSAASVNKNDETEKNDEIGKEEIYVVESDLTSDVGTISPESVNQNPASAEKVEGTETNKIKSNDSTAETKIIETVRASTINVKLNAKQPTEFYRIGVKDVLDIQLFYSNGAKISSSGADSTLYTVLDGGTIDYPLAGESLKVEGLSSEEIAETLRDKIKLYDNLQVKVGIREFASHRVTINGLVERPGIKVLSRESMPLFALLTEAGQSPSANRAIIKRKNQPDVTIELNKLSSDALVQANDLILVTAEKSNFYYIAGAVVNAGQKEFYAGITLTQAILAAGGISRNANMKIVISRQNQAGLLVSKEFNLKQIKTGKVPDPSLEVGDRIEIGN